MPSTIPSRVAAIHWIAECLDADAARGGTRRPGIAFKPVAVEGLGYRPELDYEVAGEVLRLGLVRFSRHRRTKAASSLPMMIRASEPPIKERREI